MDSKLTLKLNNSSIHRAKHYISKHKSNSLSKLVESYFDSLTSNEENAISLKLPPIVLSLAGIIKKQALINVEDDYTKYLIEKYK
jgi:hypothetical protein